MGQVVIASRLSDGLVVFLSEGGEWVEKLSEGAVAADEAEAAKLLEAAERDERERNLVVAPYLIDVEVKDGEMRGTSFREAIRSLGPTNRPDVGKQAE